MTQLNIFILDVGQGDTSIIQTPSGKIIVIDAYVKEKIQNIFKKQLNDTKQIETLVITHPHVDHFQAADYFLDNNFTIEKVILPPFWLKSGYGSVSYQSLINLFLKNHDIEVEFLSGYMRLYPDLGSSLGGTFAPGSMGQLYFELLGPCQRMLNDMYDINEINPNHLSIISRFVWCSSADDKDPANFSMIFAADAQMENWAAFDREGMLKKCKILRAAHHGSKNGTQWERLERLAPDYTIISSDPDGKDNIPDLVGCATFLEHECKSKKKVYMTKDTGTMKIEVEQTAAGFSYKFYSFKNSGTKTDDFSTPPTIFSGSSYQTDWKQLTQSKV